MPTSTEMRNIERYAKLHGYQVGNVGSESVEFIYDSASYLLTHEQIRQAVYPDPPKGATYRDENWHFYKCNGTSWFVHMLGKGWTHVNRMPRFLVCIESHEVIEFG